MSRKKRSLFRELLAGIRAMRDHAEGKVELRTSRVSPSPTTLEETGTQANGSPLSPSPQATVTRVRSHP
jgi:hypothetical protein